MNKPEKTIEFPPLTIEEMIEHLKNSDVEQDRQIAEVMENQLKKAGGLIHKDILTMLQALGYPFVEETVEELEGYIKK